jgi:hypothetical protein
MNVMGYWKNGMLEYWIWRDEIYFYMDEFHQKFKSGHHALSEPDIPLFHLAIIP